MQVDTTQDCKAVCRSYRGRPRRRCTGIGLAEVLVALLVFSIGMLGLAQLQVIGLRSSHESHLRGQAVLLAADLADRMRANRLGVVALDGTHVGFYDSADTTNYQGSVNRGCTQGSNPANTCSVAQMASHDMSEWLQSIAARLPDGDATACIDSTPDDGTASDTAANRACDGIGDTYAIKTWWTQIEEGGAVTKRYVMEFKL